MNDTEPGLDLHDWQTRWSELDELAHESPQEAVAEMDRYLEQILAERGFQLDEPVTLEGEEAEVVKQFVAAREIARLATAGDADPGDVAAAIDGYRALFEHLVSERSAP